MSTPSNPLAEELVGVLWEPTRSHAHYLEHYSVPYVAAHSLYCVVEYGQERDAQFTEVRKKLGEDISEDNLPTRINCCNRVIGHIQITALPRDLHQSHPWSSWRRLGIWHPVWENFFLGIVRGFPKYTP